MLCCLNPYCNSPHNTDDATQCISCGQPLESSLRGHYRPVQLLGQGGFGRTYLATDQDRLGTYCVIKQFSPRVQGTKSRQKAVQLFNQEAVRLHDLGEHPQIPTLLAYFEQDGFLYLIQQFIKGQNLAQLVRRQGSFSDGQLQEMLLDILPVLKFVHEHQVIHRDITPMNILQRQSDHRLVLIDFGVAKRISEVADNLTGTRIGTEGYAPMEQFRSGRAYPASDLYSLGATCLYLLTQTRPDNLYDPLEGRWIWREQLANQGRSISDRLGAVLDRMLKDLVSERYQAATEVIQDLTQITVPAGPHPPSVGSPSPVPPGAAIAPPPTAPPAISGNLSSAPTAVSGTPVSRPSGTPISNPFASGNFSPVSRPPTSGPTERGCLHVLDGHSSWVTGLAFSPDQQLLVSSGLDDTIYLWSTMTGQPVATLTGHSRAVNAVVISPDGNTLISGSDDYTIKEWQVSTGNLVRTLRGHSRDVNALAISPNGKLLASGGEDRTIKLWQMGTGTLITTLVGVAGMVRSIAMSPDGKILASGGFDNKIKLWSLMTGEQLQAWVAHRNSVNALAISPDSELLASGSKDRTVRIWNLSTGRMIHAIQGHNRDVNALTFTPDGQLLISASSDATLKLWNVQTGALVKSHRAHLDSVNAIALSQDGKLLASGSSDKTVKLWRLAELL
jgi:serine/threonine protein kinase